MAGYWKVLSAAVGLTAFIGFAGNAQATPCGTLNGDACNVTNVTIDPANGQNYTIDGGSQYAGLIDFHITNWNGNSTVDIYMVCDDYTDHVYLGSSESYYIKSADDYLFPLGTTVIHEIAGLTFFALGNAGNAVNAGDAQMAVWDLMYGGTKFLSNPDAAHILALESQALTYYNLMLSEGFSYAEFESPTGNCTGTLTFESSPDCQIQGQMVLLNPRNTKIVLPEPGTLGLFGMALLALGGLGWMRSRRGFGIG